MWIQKEINLRPRERGFHLITEEVERSIREIRQIRAGLLNIFIKHTSASLTINENADPTVRADFEQYFNHVAPENEPYYQHIFEGSDDAPAHFKSSILGSSIQIPITNGKAKFRYMARYLSR